MDRSDFTANISFVLSAHAQLINGNATLDNFERVDIRSGSGNDKLTGGNLADTFAGNAGNDALTGLAGGDWLYGGKGKDDLKGGDGADHLWAGDSYSAGADSDADSLDGGDGNDQLYFNDGDKAVGGSGSDTAHLDLSALTAGVSFQFSTGSVKVNSTTSFSQMEVLDFTGTSGADNVTAGTGDDTLRGMAGNDVLNGAGGNNTLADGAGSDRLRGGNGDDVLFRNDFAGKDVFDGGSGTDTLSFNDEDDLSVKLDLADSSNNDGMALGLTVSSIERVFGSSQDDDISGTGAGEFLSGGSEGDKLDGRGGNDTLVGGAGADLLTGGAGKDVFLFDDFLSGGDDVTDFSHGEDVIAIDYLTFHLKENYSLNLIQGTDPEAKTNAATFLYETDTHRLWFDADGKAGDEEACLVATFEDVKSLSASDFDFV